MSPPMLIWLDMDSVIIFCAKYLFIAVVLLYLLALVQASRKHRKTLIVSLIVAGIVAVALDKLGGKLYYDPRPFVSQHLRPLIQHSADNGFPSEHAVFSMTIGILLTYYRRRLGVLAMLLAYIVGVARVAAHVHSPIDIIGGIIIAAVAATIGYFAAEKLLDQPKHRVGRSPDSN
jgi:undecaprenyl-diphosphatase